MTYKPAYMSIFLALGSLTFPSWHPLGDPVFHQDAGELSVNAEEREKVIDEIAETIEMRYFDVERGAEIAQSIRDLVRAGHFSNEESSLSFASAISKALSPIDGHFRVDWTPEGLHNEGSGAGTVEPMSFDNMLARQGFGFKTVEVLPGNVGYIEMTNFANINFEDPADSAKQAADAALQLTANSDALILDLRQNGGGAPSMVGYLVSAFIPPGRDIYNIFHSRRGTQSEEPKVSFPTPWVEKPLLILISARTGSAAEALPYTLQAAGRALVVGEASLGAANPGSTIQLSDGYSIFVPSGSPINPITGTNWEKTGVHPDVEAEPSNALEVAHVTALRMIGSEENLNVDALWTLEAKTALQGVPLSDMNLQSYEGQFGDWQVQVDGSNLILTAGRRPAIKLSPLTSMLWTDLDSPTERYRFFSSNGQISAVQLETAYGRTRRERRTV